MKNKIEAVLVTIAGVLLLLPLLGVENLEILTQGMMDWVIALAVLVIGILEISKNFKK